MINKGGTLEGPAMRSSAGATGTRTTTPASSISTTTGPTTTTTTSGSADPRLQRLHTEHAHGRFILGRGSPGDYPKARQHAKPETAAGPAGAAAECGSTFHRLTGLANLYQCWLLASKNKSQSIRVQKFGGDPLRFLSIIQRRLRDGTYRFGPYKSFTVREKKFRHVVDAPMKDRVVHWMLYDYMLPLWQRRFILDTYGNLPDRGTHAAVYRLAQFARSPSATYVLQLDISKYFYSVQHDLLKARVQRYIGDQQVRRLLIDLVDSYTTDGRYDDLFPADSAYRMTLAKGMPIGNLSSQLFANIYLANFDRWIKQNLRIERYIRYVDDLVILGSSHAQLRAISDQVADRLAADGLTVHPHKIRLAPAAAGIPFLGHIVWPNHISMGRYTRTRYLRRLREHESGSIDRSEAIQSYQSMFRHTGTTH